MKILLLMPNGHIHKIKLGKFERSMREAPLTLTLLAALAPAELLIDFTLIDESVDNVPTEKKFDLVAISAITGTSKRAYLWASYFRKQGVPVVIGGVHATLLPDEVSKHADHVITGPAENNWPTFLRDFSAGNSLKKFYRETNFKDPSLLRWPTAHRHLQKKSRYNLPYTVAATRGCRHACSFCTVSKVWKGYATRPVGDVINEIRNSDRLLAFNDVSLVDDVDYAKELFQAMIPLKKRWGGLATVKIGNDPELVELMAKSGCKYLLIGFESFSQSALCGVNKENNNQKQYLHLMQLLHSHGISVQGCFIFGFDQDDPDVFVHTVEQVQILKIDIPRYAILTPYPGTPLYKRLDNEGRILTYDWSNYDTMHVVFQPSQMSVQELYTGFKWAYRKTFRILPILSRTKGPRFSSFINLVGNITYRRFVNRLENHPRYAAPFGDLECFERIIPD
jgi:radical SAM superfamily enzyme YgiQ (UPF0313 family)